MKTETTTNLKRKEITLYSKSTDNPNKKKTSFYFFIFWFSFSPVWDIKPHICILFFLGELFFQKKEKMRWERVQQQLQQGVAIEELNGPRKRWGHTCNSIKGGRFLYVFGGYGKDNCQTNQVHVFDTGGLSLLLLFFSCFYFSLYILSSLSFSLLQFWGFLWCLYEIWIFCLLGILRIFFFVSWH